MGILSLKSPREDEVRRLAAHKLVTQLVRELHQAETSAAEHCPREAARLADAPAAVVLRAIADHARTARDELRAITRARNLSSSRPAAALGSFFSIARVSFFDRLVPLHLAYRGTLLGLRHCVDLVTLLDRALLEAGMADIEPWCKRWLAVRVPLVERASRHVTWLAVHAHVAVRRPTLRESLLGNGASTACRADKEAGASVEPVTA